MSVLSMTASTSVFYDRYRNELYFLTGLFIFAFILVLVSWLRIRRRSREERKNLEMLEEIHKRLRLSMDGGRVALWDIQGENIEFDENYTRLVGMEQRTFVRTDFLKYAYPDDVPLLNSLYETLHQSTDMHVRRVRFSFSEENYRWYELRCRSLKDAKGRIMLAGIMQDIQLQVEREEQLIQAKQMAENAELKQSFLNNMSHEIRTPLNAIVGFSDLLVEAEDIEERKEYVKIVRNNNELLLQLITDILDLSKIEAGTFDFTYGDVNVNLLCENIVRSMEMKVSEGVALVFDSNLPQYHLISDRNRLHQVISNFVNNAIKFTSQGSIRVGYQMKGEELEFYVQDTGIGIDKEQQLHIFERFVKLNSFVPGTGLGLAICQSIIEQLGGRIGVDSEPGKGSRFWFRLPGVIVAE